MTERKVGLTVMLSSVSITKIEVLAKASGKSLSRVARELIEKALEGAAS